MAIPSTGASVERSGIVTARAANAPAAFGDDLEVTVPAFGHARSLVAGWVPRSVADPTPSVGDECLLAYDEHGNPWVIAWAA